MYEHDIRWYALVPDSLLLGLALLLAETAGWWGAFPVRPDLFWCLAFYAALKSPPTPSIMAFAWCGFARDMLLGSRPGASCLAFVVAGWLVLHWKPLAAIRGWLGQAVLSGAGAFAAGLIRHGLDAGRLAGVLWERIFFSALGDGVLTILAYVPAALIFSLSPFRPWRERRRFDL